LSKVLEAWNDKWRNMRVKHIFTFSDTMKDFFANSRILRADYVEHNYEYYDEWRQMMSK